MCPGGSYLFSRISSVPSGEVPCIILETTVYVKACFSMLLRKLLCTTLSPSLSLAGHQKFEVLSQRLPLGINSMEYGNQLYDQCDESHLLRSQFHQILRLTFIWCPYDPRSESFL